MLVYNNAGSYHSTSMTPNDRRHHDRSEANLADHTTKNLFGPTTVSLVTLLVVEKAGHEEIPGFLTCKISAQSDVRTEVTQPCCHGQQQH